MSYTQKETGYKYSCSKLNEELNEVFVQLSGGLNCLIADGKSRRTVYEEALSGQSLKSDNKWSFRRKAQMHINNTCTRNPDANSKQTLL